MAEFMALVHLGPWAWWRGLLTSLEPGAKPTPRKRCLEFLRPGIFLRSLQISSALLRRDRRLDGGEPAAECPVKSFLAPHALSLGDGAPGLPPSDCLTCVRSSQDNLANRGPRSPGPSAASWGPGAVHRVPFTACREQQQPSFRSPSAFRLPPPSRCPQNCQGEPRRRRPIRRPGSSEAGAAPAPEAEAE